jgi:hypothetical protein
VGEQRERSRLKLRQLQGQLRGKTTMAISKQQTLLWRMLKRNAAHFACKAIWFSDGE